MSITGPDLGASSTWVFNQYANGPNQTFYDDGVAAALDTQCRFDGSFLKNIKVGARDSMQNEAFRSYSYSGRNLTTNGLALAANQSNAIAVSSLSGLVQDFPTNFFDGQAGYSGGFLVFSPDALLGDNVRNNFAAAGILPNNALAENLIHRCLFREKTYLVVDFGFFDNRIRGNGGVRFVKTDTFVQAQVSTTAGIVPRTADNSYTNVLPTFNLTANLTKDTLARSGYGRGSPGPIRPRSTRRWSST